MAEVAGGGRQRRHLVLGQARGGDVDEHDGLVAGQAVEARQRLRVEDVDGQPAGPEGVGEGRALARRAFGEEHGAGPLHLDGGEADVVLGHGVALAGDPDAVAGEPGAAGDLGDGDLRPADGDVDDPLVDDVAVAQQRELDGAGAVGVDGDDDVEGVAFADPRRHVDAGDGEVGLGAAPDEVVLDGDPGVGQPARLGGGVAVGGATVGHDDDAPSGVGGQHAFGQAQGARQVRAVGVDAGRRLVEARVGLDRELEPGVAAEAGDGGDGAVGHLGERVLHPVDGLGPAGAAERRRAVEEEHDRDPVGAPEHRRCEEGGDQQRGDGDPQRDRGAPLAPSDAAAAPGDEPLGDEHGEQRPHDPCPQAVAPGRAARRRAGSGGPG